MIVFPFWTPLPRIHWCITLFITPLHVLLSFCTQHFHSACNLQLPPEPSLPTHQPCLLPPKAPEIECFFRGWAAPGPGLALQGALEGWTVSSPSWCWAVLGAIPWEAWCSSECWVAVQVALGEHNRDRWGIFSLWCCYLKAGFPSKQLTFTFEKHRIPTSCKENRR